MKKLLSISILALGFVASPAIAAIKTITLSVPGMTCPSCPFIVDQSLRAVPGVSNVEVSFEARTATVTFDDGATNVDALVKATTNAGYPSSPKS
jgi:mercuric ion binding protein